MKQNKKAGTEIKNELAGVVGEIKKLAEGKNKRKELLMKNLTDLAEINRRERKFVREVF